MLNSSSPSQVSSYLLRQQRQRLSCLAGGGSGRLLEIILCIRARHGIIRGGTHFALPRDYHHPSGSGEQLCWVGGGRGSAEGRPKLIPRMPPISGARPRYPGRRSGRDAERAGRAGQRAGLRAGQGCGHRCSGHRRSQALQPRSPARRWEEPGVHWLRGARSDWPGAALQQNVICWQNLGGRCPSLSLARGGMQERGPATSATPGSGCHLQPGSGIPCEMGNPGFLSLPAASRDTSMNWPCRAADYQSEFNTHKASRSVLNARIGCTDKPQGKKK